MAELRADYSSFAIRGENPDSGILPKSMMDFIDISL